MTSLLSTETTQGDRAARVQDELTEQGWSVLESVVPLAQCQLLTQALAQAQTICEMVRHASGLEANMAGTVHHLLGQHPAFLDFLEALPLVECLSTFFSSPCILNSFGGVLNPPIPSQASPTAPFAYVGQIHRDVRVFTGDFPLMLNMLVMLDAFTVDNGATAFLSGSHRHSEKPQPDKFWANAQQAVAPAGSIVLFNSNLWHAAAPNHSHKTRHALTLTFSKPLMKPQMDYLAYLGVDRIREATPLLQQLLGLHSRVPTCLEEWYQPAESRFYRSGQDTDSLR